MAAGNFLFLECFLCPFSTRSWVLFYDEVADAFRNICLFNICLFRPHFTVRIHGKFWVRNNLIFILLFLELTQSCFPFLLPITLTQNLIKNPFYLSIWFRNKSRLSAAENQRCRAVVPNHCLCFGNWFFALLCFHTYLFVQNVMFCINAGTSFELICTKIHNSTVLNEFVMCLTFCYSLHSLLSFRCCVFLFCFVVSLKNYTSN